MWGGGCLPGAVSAGAVGGAAGVSPGCLGWKIPPPPSHLDSVTVAGRGGSGPVMPDTVTAGVAAEPPPEVGGHTHFFIVRPWPPLPPAPPSGTSIQLPSVTTTREATATPEPIAPSPSLTPGQSPPLSPEQSPIPIPELAHSESHGPSPSVSPEQFASLILLTSAFPSAGHAAILSPVLAPASSLEQPPAAS